MIQCFKEPIMLIPLVPLKFRKRSGRPPRKPTVIPPIGLLITQVTIPGEDTVLRVYFSAAISWDGSSVPTQFKAFTNDGFMDSPIDVVSVGTDWIEVEFNGGLVVGRAWELDGAMAGITPAVLF